MKVTAEIANKLNELAFCLPREAAARTQLMQAETNMKHAAEAVRNAKELIFSQIPEECGDWLNETRQILPYPKVQSRSWHQFSEP